MFIHKPTCSGTCRAVRCGTIKRYVGRHRTWSCDQVSCYTTKTRFAIFPSPFGIKLFQTRESLVRDIPAGDGKIANLFLCCMIPLPILLNHTFQGPLAGSSNISVRPFVTLQNCKIDQWLMYCTEAILTCSMFAPLKTDAPFLEPKH
jgi:hypothetical protein